VGMCVLRWWLCAYRIKTVLQCDQVLVMEQGRVRELGPPSFLLQQPGSYFLALHSEHTR
jgi:ABC-type multidrug transport system fused ATPase/permease subunit